MFQKEIPNTKRNRVLMQNLQQMAEEYLQKPCDVYRILCLSFTKSKARD